MAENLYSLAQAALILGVQENELRLLIDRNELHALKHNEMVFLRTDEVIALQKNEGVLRGAYRGQNAHSVVSGSRKRIRPDILIPEDQVTLHDDSNHESPLHLIREDEPETIHGEHIELSAEDWEILKSVFPQGTRFGITLRQINRNPETVLDLQMEAQRIKLDFKANSSTETIVSHMKSLTAWNDRVNLSTYDHIASLLQAKPRLPRLEGNALDIPQVELEALLSIFPIDANFVGTIKGLSSQTVEQLRGYAKKISLMELGKKSRSEIVKELKAPAAEHKTSIFHLIEDTVLYYGPEGENLPRISASQKTTPTVSTMSSAAPTPSRVIIAHLDQEYPPYLFADAPDRKVSLFDIVEAVGAKDARAISAVDPIANTPVVVSLDGGTTYEQISLAQLLTYVSNDYSKMEGLVAISGITSPVTLRRLGTILKNDLSKAEITYPTPTAVKSMAPAAAPTAAFAAPKISAPEVVAPVVKIRAKSPKKGTAKFLKATSNAFGALAEDMEFASKYGLRAANTRRIHRLKRKAGVTARKATRKIKVPTAIKENKIAAASLATALTGVGVALTGHLIAGGITTLVGGSAFGYVTRKAKRSSVEAPKVEAAVEAPKAEVKVEAPAKKVGKIRTALRHYNANKAARKAEKTKKQAAAAEQEAARRKAIAEGKPIVVEKTSSKFGRWGWGMGLAAATVIGASAIIFYHNHNKKAPEVLPATYNEFTEKDTRSPEFQNYEAVVGKLTVGDKQFMSSYNEPTRALIAQIMLLWNTNQIPLAHPVQDRYMGRAELALANLRQAALENIKANTKAIDASTAMPGSQMLAAAQAQQTSSEAAYLSNYTAPEGGVSGILTVLAMTAAPREVVQKTIDTVTPGTPANSYREAANNSFISAFRERSLPPYVDLSAVAVATTQPAAPVAAPVVTSTVAPQPVVVQAAPTTAPAPAVVTASPPAHETPAVEVTTPAVAVVAAPATQPVVQQPALVMKTTTVVVTPEAPATSNQLGQAAQVKTPQLLNQPATLQEVRQFLSSTNDGLQHP